MMPPPHVCRQADVWQACDQLEGTMRGIDVRCVSGGIPPHAPLTVDAVSDLGWWDRRSR